MSQAHFGAQCRVAEVGNRRLVTRIFDREGLGDELGREFGASGGNVVKTEHRRVDARARDDRSLLGVSQVIGLLADGLAKQVEAEVTRILDEGARRQHGSALSKRGRGEGRERGHGDESTEGKQRGFPQAVFFETGHCADAHRSRRQSRSLAGAAGYTRDLEHIQGGSETASLLEPPTQGRGDQFPRCPSPREDRQLYSARTYNFVNHFDFLACAWEIASRIPNH